jgi:hypothetical protein
MKHISFLGIALSLGLVGCSTASVRMMPGETQNRVTARDLEREGAEEAAVKAAGKYCEERGEDVVFVNNADAKYTGELSESTRNTLRRGSQAAMILGGAGMVPHRTRPYGGLLGTAGTVGYVMTNGKDYEASVDFKCRTRTASVK